MSFDPSDVRERQRLAPAPARMPVNAEEWKKQFSISNFVNTYYQFRDLQHFSGCRKVLIVGPGNGFDALVLRWRGYEVQTLDIDSTFDPDFIGSVNDLSRFGDGTFDAVIASHVLEHLAEPHLDASLGELARVAQHALIYLPVHGQHMQLRLIPGFRALDFSVVVDVFNYFRRPSGLSPDYMSGQHFWEVGMRGFRVGDVVRRMSRHFDVRKHYRNKDWLPSYNFVLDSRRIGTPRA